MHREALSYHQAAQVLCREDGEDLRRACDILESELEATKSSTLAESVEAESYGENIEEGSKHGEDDDGEEGGEELLVVEGYGGVEYDRRQKNVEEEVGAELWKRVDSILIDTFPKGRLDYHPEKSADKDEDARFRQEPLQHREMVEEDLEDDGKDDKARD